MTVKESFKKWHNNKQDTFIMEDVYIAGHKEGRKRTLEEFKKFISNTDLDDIYRLMYWQINEYIDTELKKLEGE